MATFPDSPSEKGGARFGGGGLGIPKVGPKVANFFTPQPGGNQTLQALMLRQKELAQRGGEMPQIQSWTQGLSHALAETMTGFEEGSVRREQERGNAAVAKALGSADPNTGLYSPEAAASVAPWDQELAYRMLSDRREQMNFEATLAAKTAETGEIKQSDIASVAADYQADPLVKKIKNAAPMWDSMLDASTRDTPQADLNMVIALAKLFDPDSVVRSSETEGVELTGDLPSSILGQFKYLTGTAGARLSKDVRTGMLQEGYSRMQGYFKYYDPLAKHYTERALRARMNPADIVQNFTMPDPFDPEKVVGSNVTGDPDQPTTLPELEPEDAAAYDLLKPGSQYRVKGDPPGQYRVKPGAQ